MTTPLSICNLGVAKIAASRLSTINPPRSPVERHCADGYPNWRDSELGKRRWRFALENKTLTQSGPELEGEIRKYRYNLPNDCIRPIRERDTEWEQRGKYLYSAYPKLKITYIRRANEDEFTPEFINLLACRVAAECAELVTQSNQKVADANVLYKEALKDAASVNAFVIGPESITTLDQNSEWLTARHY